MIGRAVALAIVLSGVASAQAISPQQQHAAALDAFEAGRRAFETNDYETAIAQFGLAYRLEADPGYLFNLAQAQRLAQHCSDAAQSYRKFLALVPHPPNHDRIVEWIAAEDACAKDLTLTPTPTAAAPTTTSPVAATSVTVTAQPIDAHARSLLPTYVAGAAGLVGIGLAAYFTWDVGHLESEREALCAGASPCEWNMTKSQSAADLASRGSRAEDAAIATWVIGGAAIAGAAAYYLFGHTRGDEPVVSLVPTPHGAAAGLALTF